MVLEANRMLAEEELAADADVLREPLLIKAA
jgi:hypothetical protein